MHVCCRAFIYEEYKTIQKAGRIIIISEEKRKRQSCSFSTCYIFSMLGIWRTFISLSLPHLLFKAPASTGSTYIYKMNGKQLWNAGVSGCACVYGRKIIREGRMIKR
jgi:hypothetical protein